MNTIELRDKIQLGLPFNDPKCNTITQYFGVNRKFYIRYGIEGHNGIDHLAPRGTPILAVCNGICSGIKTTKEGYGIYVRQSSEEIGGGDKLDIVYGHMERVNSTPGEEIKKGQVVGWADNTGYSFGNHLHLGVRIMDSAGRIKNYENGFLGYIDHYPLLEDKISWLTYMKWKEISKTIVPEWEITPIDKRYGIKGEKRLPWTTYIWIGIKLRRQLKEREHVALAYGHWDFDAVFNGRVGKWFKYYTKDEYINRIKNNLGL